MGENRCPIRQETRTRHCYQPDITAGGGSVKRMKGLEDDEREYAPQWLCLLGG
jgi:hypothetical protein